jgi:hypothetical protein
VGGHRFCGWKQITGCGQWFQHVWRWHLHLTIRSHTRFETDFFGRNSRAFLDGSLHDIHLATELRFEHDELDGRDQSTNTQYCQPAKPSDSVTAERQPILPSETLRTKVKKNNLSLEIAEDATSALKKRRKTNKPIRRKTPEEREKSMKSSITTQTKSFLTKGLMPALLATAILSLGAGSAS